MIRLILLLFFQLAFVGFILAQNDTLPKTADTLGQRETQPVIDTAHKTRIHPTVRPKKVDSLSIDSLPRQLLLDTLWQGVAGQYLDKSFIRQAWLFNKFFAFSSAPIVIRSNRKEFHGKEIFFYSLIALLLLFAFIKYSFPKYIADLFRVAFRTTLKQRQIGEQLVQTPLPSLLLNLFFVVTSSIYVSFVFQHYHLADRFNFWLLCLYCFIALTVIYAVKFLTLKFSGWLFNITITTDGYIFIVFMINKIIGIYLLPFVVLLAFTDNTLYEICFAVSYIGVFALFAYRFILAYELARNQIKVNPFHFFLYLCAFEIVPLLLIYKALLLWL